MSFASFQAVEWEAKLLRHLDNELIFKKLCNRDYEGDVSHNAMVKINSINDITIFDITRNSNISAAETLSFADQDFKVTEAKGFNFAVDNIDKQMAAGSFFAEATQRASFGFASAADNFIAGIMQAGAGLSVDAATIGIGNQEYAIYDIIVEMNVALDETNTPETGRFAAIPPFGRGLLKLDGRFTSFGTDKNRAVMRGEPIGMVDNCTIYVSNNIPRDSSEYSILVGHPMATTFADAIDGTEPYSPELRVKTDALKGEYVYGASVIRPSNLCRFDATRGQLRAS